MATELLDLDKQIRLKSRLQAVLDEHPFRPAWWLPNPHAQTVWARYQRGSAMPTFRLERWDTPDDDFLRIHFSEGVPDKPAALLLHGLEGSIQSPYIVGLARNLRAMDWTVAALEFRSCGGEMNRAPRLYHSGETTDIDFVVRGLTERWPGRPLYIAGYSLGGNVTAKWLGEIGDDAPEEVAAAAVVSAPYRLDESGPFMDSGVRLVYVRHFLKSLIPKALVKAEQYPGRIDAEAIRDAKNFEDFDTFGTAALHGFRDAKHYYTRSACGQYLDGIRRPTLLLSAADDPFNPGWTLPRDAVERSPYLISQFTTRGGHVGFVQGSRPSRAEYWAEDQIARYFSTHAAGV